MLKGILEKKGWFHAPHKFSGFTTLFLTTLSLLLLIPGIGMSVASVGNLPMPPVDNDAGMMSEEIVEGNLSDVTGIMTDLILSTSRLDIPFLETSIDQCRDMESISGKETDADEEYVDSGKGFVLLASYHENDTAKSKVDQHIYLFTTKKRRTFERWLERSGRYLDTIKSILREEGLPEELVYLPLIESGYNTSALSKARAVGPWQFIKSTARRYGLKIDYWRDERRDPIKSTRAAARYLKDLYAQFGSWALTLAAYNAGEGRVRRALYRTKSDNYWRIIRSRYLKSETKNYVSKFIAGGIIASEPEKYGFIDIDYHEPLRFEEKEIRLPASLSFIARCTNSDIKTIRELNPELKRWCTPPYLKSYIVRIPEGTGEKFSECFKSASAGERMSKVPYIVKKGDTLYDLAKKYGISRKELYALNRGINPRRLRPGMMIYLPPMDRTSEPDTALVRDETPRVFPYTVKKGDTIYDIAKEFGVSRKELLAANKGVKPRRLRPGMIIYIPQSAGIRGTKSTLKKTRVTTVPYIIKKGDTLYDIAKKYRIPRKKLFALNKGIKPERLRPGSKIYIPVVTKSM
jgi:membrane-bound lytic murein transglycosylase D